MKLNSSLGSTQCSLIRDVAHKRNFYCTNHTTFGPSDNCRGRYLKKEEIPKKNILTSDLKSLLNPPMYYFNSINPFPISIEYELTSLPQQSAQSETCN